jgi:hypothetical protein
VRLLVNGYSLAPLFRNMAKGTNNKADIGKDEFEHNGVKYRFIVFRFIIPGFDESTPIEAKTNPKALEYLVSVKSGLIEEVA